MNSEWQLDALTTAELTGLATAAIAGLRDRDYAALHNRARLDLLDEFEHLLRTLPGLGHELINQLGQQNAAAELQVKNLHVLLSERLHITSAEAKRRIAHAALLGPRTALTGQPLPAEHAPTGQAQRDGDINTEHADVILKFFKRLPDDVSPGDREKAEIQLVDLAKQTHADAVDTAARQIEAHLNPDGDEPSEKDTAGKTFFRMKPQGRDKLTHGTFCIDAETRAYVDAYFAKTDRAETLFDDVDLGDVPAPDPDPAPAPDPQPAPDPRPAPDPQPAPPSPQQQDLFDYFAESQAPEADAADGPEAAPRSEPAAPPAAPGPPPADAQPPAEAQPPADRRGLGQRRHDAIKRLFQRVLGSPALGQHRGLPVTAIITMTLAELESRTGNAMSGGGALIPMRQAIRMAAHAHHYLLIYDDDGRALHLGRARRLASADQRLVLHAGDRGCTFPDCARPGYWCQAHHVDEWAAGGHTDIDRLTFACEEHHALIGTGIADWATTVGAPGTDYAHRTIWHPPECVDPLRRGRVNHHHHPHEYLQPPRRFPGPPQHKAA